MSPQVGPPAALKGSEKQIAWAEKIRTENLANLATLRTDFAAVAAGKPGEQEMTEVANAAFDRLIAEHQARTSAAWWIDNRGNVYTDTKKAVADAVRPVHAKYKAELDRLGQQAKTERVKQMAEEDNRARKARDEQYARQAGEAIRQRDLAADSTPATTAQVDKIMELLARRRRSGSGGGFMTGPTDRAGVARMSKAEASAYIDSLSDRY